MKKVDFNKLQAGRRNGLRLDKVFNRKRLFV